MNIISDTNIFLAVALDEPEKIHIIEISGGMNASAPEILPYEIGNALSAMLKRKQITHKQAFKALKATRSIPVRLLSVDIRESLDIARKFNIYAYDAYFLQCARSTGYPLLTLDRKMHQVAIELNIEILE